MVVVVVEAMNTLDLILLDFFVLAEVYIRRFSAVCLLLCPLFCSVPTEHHRRLLLLQHRRVPLGSRQSTT